MSRTPVTSAPRARPAASVVALVLRLLVVALAAVTVRDLVVAQGWAGGTPWTTTAVESLDGLGRGTGLIVVGTLLALVGVLLVLLAVLPGRRTHLRSREADLDLWFSPAALAALARAVADRSPGVLEARTTRAGARRVGVEVSAQRDPAGVGRAAQSAVDEDVTPLTRARVVVTTAGTGASS